MPSYLTCVCCGTEFGIDDIRFRDVLDRRNNWVDAGAEWFQPAAQPETWDLIDQIGKIPEEWTLESLGVDPDKTAPRIEPSQKPWEPEHFDFYHFISQAGVNQPLPSDQQIDAFVEYFVERCSYLQVYGEDIDLPPGMGSAEGFLPNQRVVFFLNPYAGHAHGGGGAPVKMQGTVKDHVDGAWQIDTDEYLNQFGFLDFKLIPRNSQLGTSDDFHAEIRCFAKQPSTLPKPFESMGSFYFSNFLFIDSHLLSRLKHESEAKFQPVLGKVVRWFTETSRQDSEESRYEMVIREINRNRDNQGTPNDQAMKLAQELQQLEKDKLRQALRDLRTHYASYSKTSIECYTNDKDTILRRIATERASHFVLDIGFLGAYIAADRCKLLPNPEERFYATLDGERVAGIVNIPEYQAIIQAENRRVRLQKESANDKYLLANDFELDRGKEEIQIFLKERYWSYKPEEKLTPVATLPLDATIQAIDAAKLRTLRDARYFSVCELCWNRLQLMSMSNPNTCNSCEEPEQDRDHSIVY